MDGSADVSTASPDEAEIRDGDYAVPIREDAGRHEAAGEGKREGREGGEGKEEPPRINLKFSVDVHNTSEGIDALAVTVEVSTVIVWLSGRGELRGGGVTSSNHLLRNIIFLDHIFIVQDGVHDLVLPTLLVSQFTVDCVSLLSRHGTVLLLCRRSSCTVV